MLNVKSPLFCVLNYGANAHGLFDLTPVDWDKDPATKTSGDSDQAHRAADNAGAGVKAEATPDAVGGSQLPEREVPKPQRSTVTKANKEMLSKFLSGKHCLMGGQGWWRFEFCYQKHVHQVTGRTHAANVWGRRRKRTSACAGD